MGALDQLAPRDVVAGRATLARVDIDAGAIPSSPMLTSTPADPTKPRPAGVNTDRAAVLSSNPAMLVLC